MKNFDIFCGIDWSGAKTPVKNKAIAVALSWQGREAPHASGKIWSRDMVADWLCAMAGKGRRMLVGIDCNFGYCQRIGERHFGKNYTYQDLWSEVDKCAEGMENYYAGGFWENDAYKQDFWLEGKKPQWFDTQALRRVTETQCGEDGYGWPESPFKLFSAKQVGKGGLAGMRMALDLKQRLGDKIAIWPFEQDTDEAVIVMSEIYPRQFLRRSGHGNAKVRSLSELNAALEKLNSDPAEVKGADISDHDADALVSAAGLRFLCGSGTTVPDNIAHPPMLDRKTASREGWIFGVGDR